MSTTRKSDRDLADISPWAVEFVGVAKSFGAVVANRDVTFAVRRGTIHGIVGENGAGKSTAMKMLFGMIRPDRGEIRVNGRRCQWRSSRDAIKAALGMVHQHFMLAGPHTALDNIALGDEPTAAWARWLPGIAAPIDRDRVSRDLRALADEYSMTVDWDAPVESLSVGIQQRVEILKLLYRNAGILILDEPTAVLTPQETEELFRNLRRLREMGRTILIITHKLKEVLSLTDEVTVFRQGAVTGNLATRDATEERLAELMVGRGVSLREVVAPGTPGETVLRLDGVSVTTRRASKPLLSDLSFEVRAGEIVGVAGVEGNGQSDLLRLLTWPAEHARGENLGGALGARRMSGRLEILGQDGSLISGALLRSMPVAIIPEDRHRDAVMLDASLRDNFLLGQQRLSRYRAWWHTRREAWRAAVAGMMASFDVRPRDPDARMGGLSGGNQQKFVVGRELSRDPRLLIVAQPTRGVDVGSIESIHRRLVAARDAGLGVLLVSSELDEVMTLSDRLLVFHGGRVTASFARGEADETRLGVCMGGGHP